MARPVTDNGASDRVRTAESVVQRIERLIIDHQFATGEAIGCRLSASLPQS
jgi:hypothetical protein